MRPHLPFIAVVLAGASPVRAEVIGVDIVKLKPAAVGIAGPDVTTPVPFNTLALNLGIPVGKLKMRLGVGFDYVTGEVLPEQCIDPVAGRADVSTGEKAVLLGDKHEYINTVSGMVSHQNASGDSGGFTFTYKLVSAGAQSGTTSSDYFNSVDAYARIYSRFVTASSERIGGRWSKSASSALKDRKRFVEICGTHYVSAIYSGDVLDQTIRFTLKDGKRTKTDKTTLTLGLASLFGANYSHANEETSVRDVSTVTVVDDSKGLIAHGAPAPRDLGGVQAAVNFAHAAFPDAVAGSSPESNQALYIDVQPYWRLNLPGADRLPRLSEELMAKVGAKAELYERLLDAISEDGHAGAMPLTAYREF